MKRWAHLPLALLAIAAINHVTYGAESRPRGPNLARDITARLLLLETESAKFAAEKRSCGIDDGDQDRRAYVAFLTRYYPSQTVDSYLAHWDSVYRIGLLGQLPCNRDRLQKDADAVTNDMTEAERLLRLNAQPGQ